jgi:hypothetical protein
MPKRLSRAEIERTREEVKAWNHSGQADDAAPPTVRMKLSCGQEENVPAGLDPNKSICSQYRAKGMRSKQG